MRVRAAPRRVVPPVAYLDGLDGLNAHERLRQEAVELAVPMHVAAQAHGDPVGENLGHAAQRVAHLGGGLDGGDHRALGRGNEAADGAGIDALLVPGPGPGTPGGRGGLSEADDVAHHGHPDVGEEKLGQRPRGHPSRRLASRSPLEDVARVVEPVLQHAR